MFPASTHKGQAVLAFPDVSKTPAGGAPVAVPYPTMGTAATATKTATKTTTRTTTRPAAYARTSGGEAGALRSQLSTLHQKLMTMPAGDTTRWHAVLDDYVVTCAEAYKALAARR